jgi:hypothetical protein
MPVLSESARLEAEGEHLLRSGQQKVVKLVSERGPLLPLFPQSLSVLTIIQWDGFVDFALQGNILEIAMGLM